MMSKKLTRKDLKIVSDFSFAAYPYKIEANLEDHLDPIERYNKIRNFREALQMAFIKDYRLFDSYYSVAVHLRNEDDFDCVSIAMRPDGEIEQSYAYAPEGYDFRKLKNHRHIMQSIIRKTPLAGQVHIDVDREERALVVIADNKRAYLGFRSLMSDAPVLNF